MTTEKISFIVPQQGLRYLLDRARGAVGRMHPYFKIDIYLTGRITCCATDLRVGVLTELDNRNNDTAVECGGTFCVAADKFFNLVSTLPSMDVQLQGLDNYRIRISCGTYTGIVPCVDPEQHFPDMILPGGDPDIVCAGGFLNDIYAAIGHAVGNQEDTATAGINIQAINGRLVGAATNGQRLSVAGIATPYDGECEPFDTGITLAPKSIAEIKKLNCGACDVRIRENRMSIEQINITIVSRLYEAIYPNYRRVIPEHPNCAVVSVSKLIEAVQRVGILNDTREIGLSIGSNTITVSAQNTAGELIDIVPCETESEPVLILLSPAYLLESLKSLVKDGDDVIIKWLDDKSPIMILPADFSNWDERLELIVPRSN